MQTRLFSIAVREGIETFIVRRPQILSVEISAPKLVLLSKCSLYRAVQAPIGVRALRLQPHQPHG